MITVFIHGQTANTGTRITLFSAHCITQQSKVWSECHSVTAWNVPTTYKKFVSNKKVMQ